MATPATSPTTGASDDSARAALEQVLKSGVFDRAPNLALILRYVCSRHFEGRIEEIKEYNIAVDALGRSADFDQKKDSIVRVEAHRLRKRLAEYYAGAGVNDPVEIQIPAGTYVPQFVVRNPQVATETTPEPDLQPGPIPVDPPSPARRGPGPAWYLIAVTAVIVIAGTAVVFRPSPESVRARTTSPDAPSVVPVAGQHGDEIRILAGSNRDRSVDHLGNTWLSDRFVTGGEIRQSPTRPIGRTGDGSFYLQRREGYFRYEIPVRPGTYELRLHFAETVFGEGNIAGGGESSRVFAIHINDQQRPETVDVLSNAGGPNIAWIRVFRSVQPAPDGKIHIRFAPLVKEQAFVNGIEVIPSGSNSIQPVRVLAGKTPFTDSQKRIWAPDTYFEGGTYVQRHEPVTGAGDFELFQGERYGNFTYAFPVDPKSHYTVTLRFTESWFGPGRPGGGGVGSRVFDVYSGGRTLLRHFDIYKEAGGPLRAVVKTFRGLEPTAQGRLVLQFVPVENYALINSIEVLDEGK